MLNILMPGSQGESHQVIIEGLPLLKCDTHSVLGKDQPTSSASGFRFWEPGFSG